MKEKTLDLVGISPHTPHNQLSPEPTGHRTFKFTVLVLLCCQNSSHALLARYSQGILKEQYSSTEVVLVGEVIKLVASGYFAMTDRSDTDAVGSGASKLFWLLVNAQKIVVLVILYSVANITSYYALARVDASVYTVLLQLKIFTTAAFGVILLGRKYTWTKWRALLLLVIGCILVASPTYNRPVDCELLQNNKKDGSKGGDDEKVGYLQQLLGVCSVLSMVAISGYSAIYFEAMLKKTGEKITIWERNFQLAFYSTLLLAGLVVAEFTQTDETHLILFSGWTHNTVLIAVIQALGGLLVAATLKYADAVLKTLATSGAIVLSAVLGWLLLRGTLDIFISIGCVATILAIFNYIMEE